MIHRYEHLEASIFTKYESVTFVRDYSASEDEKFTYTVYYCDKPKYRKSECNFLEMDRAKGILQNKRSGESRAPGKDNAAPKG